MAKTLCSCGSGRPFDRCHGDPANEFARIQALLEARQLAALFPSVSARVLAFAGRAADETEIVDEVPEELLAEGIELVDPRVREVLALTLTAYVMELPGGYSSSTN